MLQAEEPTSDRIKTMEFNENGFMYIRVQRWEVAQIVRISFYNPKMNRIIFRTYPADGYRKGLVDVAKAVGKTVLRVN